MKRHIAGRTTNGYNLYSSPNIIRVIKFKKKIEIGRACGMYGGYERCIHVYLV